MKTLYLGFAFVLLTVSVVNGQSNKTPTGVSGQVSKEDLVAIKSRPLLVCLTGIPQVDKDIETYTKKIWTFSPVVSFHNVDEISQKIEGNKSGYAILTFSRINYILGGKIPEGTNAWFRADLKLSEKYNKTKPAFFQDMTASWEEGKNIEVRRREIVFVLNVIQNHLIAREADKRRSPINTQWEVLENAGTLQERHC